VAIKFGRNYLMTIQTSPAPGVQLSPNVSLAPGNTLTIEPPFTLEFDITRTLSSGQNPGNFRIMNLGKINRNNIRQDQTDPGNRKQVILNAGYGSKLAQIFNGFTKNAWSVREGNTWVTNISAYDGGYALDNAQTNTAIAAGQNQFQIFQNIINNDMAPYGVSLGAISPSFAAQIYGGSLKSRGGSASGASMDILKGDSNRNVYVDNGKVYVLLDSECNGANIATISSDSGLIGTPMRENYYVNVTMFLETGLLINQRVILDSTTGDPSINGAYKIVGIKHKGVISDAVCGTAYTTLNLKAGIFTPIGGA
jgi:hypothetical protein